MKGSTNRTVHSKMEAAFSNAAERSIGLFLQFDLLLCAANLHSGVAFHSGIAGNVTDFGITTSPIYFGRVEIITILSKQNSLTPRKIL